MALGEQLARQLALHRASELGDAAAAGGTDQLVPVVSDLHPLLPGLRRGSTVAVSAGATSLVLALLAGASAAGSWTAVVGMPGLSGLAAAQAGVALERLALVPHPGPEWSTVVAALLDGVDVVAVAPPGPVAPRVASRLAARARLRGSVLIGWERSAAAGRWPGADLTLTAQRAVWEGLGAGRGRLRCRELTIVLGGRGSAGRPRELRVRLPDRTGRLAPSSYVGASDAHPPAGPATRPAEQRPTLTVIDGAAEQTRAARKGRAA